MLKKISRKWLILALVVAIIAVPVVLKSRSGGRAVEVDIQTVAEQEIRPSILASGVMVYRNQVDLTAEVTARVKEIHVKEGDAVTAGQLLLRLDPANYLNEVNRDVAGERQELIGIERQKVALELKRIQFERTRKLFQSGMVGHSVFDADRNALQLAEVELKASQASAKRAEATLAEARDQLAKTEIRAPIAGRVVVLPIKVGEVAIPSTSSLAGAQLLSIADTSATEAEIKVDEGDINRVVLGQDVSVFAAAWPDKAIKGKVSRIAQSTTVENGARAYKVTIGLAVDPAMALRSGMSCRAELFLSDGRKHLAVPVEAVISESHEDKADKDDKDDAADTSPKKPVDEKRYVVVVRDGKALRVAVTSGVFDDRWQEITHGLKVGDQIAVGPGKSVRALANGDRVTRLSPGKNAK